MARLEICVDSYESAVNAISGGANQLEVCGALTLGGLTPSVGLVRRLRSSFPQTPLFIMLRPRDGDFLYTTDEVEVMLEDLRAMKTLGVGGFVFGPLLTFLSVFSSRREVAHSEKASTFACTPVSGLHGNINALTCPSAGHRKSLPKYVLNLQLVNSCFFCSATSVSLSASKRLVGLRPKLRKQNALDTTVH
ncbi:unnamed protein product [Heligmosomoides polygyrus]|uniref:Copper homeostasis protein cutC homolog n=1 Tax=Heligmosomoides polygyrus TaxID=6339 RepID=A0A183GK89_HELPZ|nr:unnamed protein product [Heligmosomoides polygyrus]